MNKRYVACALSVLMLFNAGGCGLIHSDNTSALVPSGTVPKDVLSDEERVLLGKLPYYGDMSSCRMGAHMAKAYADIISGMPYTQVAPDGKRKIKLKATLYDLTGDGFPLLIVSYPDENASGKLLSENPPRIYGYYDGETNLAAFGEWGDLRTLELCITDDRYGFCVRMPHGMEAGSPVGYQFFNVNKGKITRSYTVSEYVAVILKDDKTAFSLEMPAVKSPKPVVMQYTDVSTGPASSDDAASTSTASKSVAGFATTTEILETAGWRRSGSAYYYYRINGEGWDPSSLTFTSDSMLDDVLISLGIQIPNATGDRLIYSRASGMAWWLPYMDAQETESILNEFATFEKEE